LKAGQSSNEISGWIKYFAETVLLAQRHASEQIRFILKKTRFFSRFKDELNERQLKVIRKMFDAGPEGLKGGMNAGKYVALTKVSKATATRDLQKLAELKALLPQAGGRSTHYLLNMDPD
jgi:Fic family protein